MLELHEAAAESNCSPNFVQTEEDLPFEEDVIRNSYVLKAWLRYIEHKQESPAYIRNILYERAVKELPGSYKLWSMYLMDLKRQVRGRVITDPFYEEINNSFERCLVFLSRVCIGSINFQGYCYCGTSIVRFAPHSSISDASHLD